jgi:DNA polymerase III delta prime subunit
MAAQSVLVPLTVLLIAHRADEGLCNTLKKHLSPLLRQASIDIRLSYVSETQRSSTLADMLDQDTVVLLLISPDLLVSATCDTILSMLEEQGENEGQIIPVLLRPANWEETPLARLQYLPHDGRPVTKWSNRDEAFLTIARELKEVLQAFAPSAFQESSSTNVGHALSAEERSYHELLLRRVHDFWIAGVLEQSQQTGAHLTHNLHMKPGAFANPWQKAMQESNRPGYDLPPGTRIIDVYDEVGRELLILGDPGSGKTTLLLELARDLGERAAQDTSAPIPVYFHLSYWAEKREPIARWLADELHDRYLIPVKIARQWIKTHRLHLLLDGLDEIADAIMPACIAALNEYLSEHGLTSIALCCRLASYLDQQARLALHHAVVIEPLTEQQIDAYLASVDGSEELQAMLKQDVALRHMASSPLMLSILALAYRNRSAAKLSDGELTPALLQKRVFATYVEEMLSRRGEHPIYTEDKTEGWLAWLAWQMRKHNQPVFYPELIQPDWLSARRSRTIYYTCIALIAILTFGTACGLSILIYGYVVWFVALLGALVGGSCIEFVGARKQPVRVMSRTARKGNVAFFLSTVLWFFIALGGMISPSTKIGFIPVLLALFFILVFLVLIITVIDLSIITLLNAVRRRAPESIAPDYDFKRSIRTEVFSGLLCSFLFIGIVGMVQMLSGSKGDFASIYVLSAILGLLCGLIFGGMAAIQLKIIQRLLRDEGVMPDSYVQFLNYATERLLLRRGGGSYTFVHSLLRDYLADQYEESRREKSRQR